MRAIRRALYAFERGGTRFYVGSDQVGSPRVVFKGDGTIVKRIDYDAFGAVLPDSDLSFALPIGFAGGISDPTTGLVRFGLRDYDPMTGRFTARDPIFFDGSPSNLYAYANSDRVGSRDPTGMFCVGVSGYAGVGGGVQYCRKQGKNSICAERGVGAGGGIDVDPFGNVADSGATLQGEITGKCGPVHGTLGLDLDLDCMDIKGSAKLGTAIGTAVSITPRRDGEHLGGSDEGDFNRRGVRRENGSWASRLRASSRSGAAPSPDPREHVAASKRGEAATSGGGAERRGSRR